MKKYYIFITLLMWSLWSFSQVLKPKIQSIRGETHFCFTIPQSRIIIKNLQEKAYTDSINSTLTKSNATQKELLKIKDSILNMEKAKSANLKTVIKNQTTIIDALTLSLKEEKNTRKKRSFFTKVGVVLIMITGILIAK